MMSQDEARQANIDKKNVDNALAQLARKGNFLPFILNTMPHFEYNWHHGKIENVATRWMNKEIKRLLVFMPPRHGKTEMLSARLPAFIFGHRPNSQIIGTSYGAELASKINRQIQKIIDSPTYSNIFPDSRISGQTQKTAGAIRNSDVFEIVGTRGSYRSAGIGGSITGTGADYLIIDDPIKNREEANSLTYRNKIWDWYTSTAYTRLEKNGSILIVLTRWHEDDLAGRLLKEQKENPDADKWEILSLEAIKESNNEKDPREIGEPLWPWKYDKERLAGIRGTIGRRDWDALYQQRPSAIEGSLFKSAWWKYYDERPMSGGSIVQFWDCAQKPGLTNDYTVCATWMKTQTGYYLLDLYRAKVEYPQLINSVKALHSKWKPIAVVIEDKASGISLIQDIRQSTTIPVLAYNPNQRDKETRASAATPSVEAGNCYLPKGTSWLHDFITEHEVFPNGAHDDIVDTTSMMVEHFNSNSNAGPRIRSL
jgi:predicted phage terminase large subunit-like protein